MFVESRNFRRTGFPADCRKKARLCLLEVLGFAQRGEMTLFMRRNLVYYRGVFFVKKEKNSLVGIISPVSL